MSEKIWFLKRCNLFERLTPQEMERLERRAIIRLFKRREIIYFPTEPGQSVLILACGRVKLKDITQDGKETILAFIDEGEIFGELSLLDGEPRSEFAEAVEESQVLVLPREDVLWLMQQRPDVAMCVTKLVGFRRRRMENRLRNLLFRSNRERLAHVLLDLVGSHGQRVGDRWEIRLRLSHQDLASLIGATRETVTLVLGQLQADRLLQIRRRSLRILDLERLAAEAHDPLTPVPAPASRQVGPNPEERLPRAAK